MFPDRANFVNLKSGGLLASADDVASRVLTYLARPDFGAQPVADVRDCHKRKDTVAGIGGRNEFLATFLIANHARGYWAKCQFNLEISGI